MGEPIISSLALGLAKGAAEKVGESIYVSFQQKVILITRFSENLRMVREDLVELSTFVKDASSKYDEQPDYIKHWTVKLYQTSLDAQLVLDLFQAHQDHPPFSLSGFHVRFRYEMGKMIQDIQSSIKELYGKVGMLGLVRGLGDSQQIPNYENPRSEGSTLIAEDTSVDLDYRVAHVRRMLDKGRVVAAVGMGGIGKTRLLQHVFKELRSEYEAAIWLSVTQNYSIDSLQSDMLSQLHYENVQDVSDGRCQDIIVDLLSQKKTCLVVLDDVWDLSEAESKQFLSVYHKLRRVGLIEHDNCKILISTREETVTHSFNAQIYRVELLNDEESMQLFCHRMTGGFSLEDQSTVRRILQKCGGLPLAILAMTGVLANQRTRHWNSTLQELQVLSSNSSATSQIMNILGLSYRALPYQLKRCFASLSICKVFFWEMIVIGTWKAQGLVISIEEGRQVTQQLISRSLLEVVENLYVRVPSSGHLSMHDMVRDTASSISTEMGDLCRDRQNIQQWSNARCIDLRNGQIKSLSNFSCCGSKVTTLGVSGNRELNTIPPCFLKNATSLKVFDISYTSISKLADDSLPALKLLKYLDLRGTKIDVMPECIRRLKSLEFLFLPKKIVELPHWLGELTMLQVICCDASATLSNAKWVRNLKNLRLVEGYFLEMDKDILTWNDLSTLPLLRLSIIANHEGIISEGGVGPPQSLEYLCVFNNTGIVCDMPDTWQSISNIDTLAICDVRVPRWANMFQRLRVLLLGGKNIEGCHVEGISELPRLQRLLLLFNDSCKSLPDMFGKKQSFPMLRELEIGELTNLEKMPELEDGAMPQLKCLFIKDCPRMQYNSKGLSEIVSRLDLLGLEGCGDDFTMKMRSENTKACLAWEANAKSAKDRMRKFQ